LVFLSRNYFLFLNIKSVARTAKRTTAARARHMPVSAAALGAVVMALVAVC